MIKQSSLVMKMSLCKLPLMIGLALGGVNTTFANIPEPDIVFFGQVTSKIGALDVPLNDGVLTWEIHPKESAGKVYRYETQLTNMSEGKYSYSLKVPQEILVDIDTLMPKQENGLSIEDQKELFLKHYSIRVNGEKALLKDESLAFFTSSQQNRAPYIQLDLEVSSKVLGENLDLNGNGMPDLWETFYDISDADADADADGWTNLEEYEQGTDPLRNNRVPLLRGENGSSISPAVTLYENGLVQLRLLIADSDSKPEDLSLSIDTLPDGLQVFHVENMDQALSQGDSISSADLQVGAFFARYQPEILLDEQGNSIEPEEWVVSLHDSGPLHSSNVSDSPVEDGSESQLPADPAINEPVVAKIKLNIFRPSTIADPVRWIDGMAFKGRSITSLPGRSGHALDTLAHHYFDAADTIFAESGNEIIIDNVGLIQPSDWGEMLAFKEPDDVSLRLDLSGDKSIFSVHVTDPVPYENVIFNDGRISLSEISSQLLFGPTSSNGYVASTSKVDGGLDITAVHTQGGMSYLDYNGVQVGGPTHHIAEVTTEASSLAGFGFALGAFGEYQGMVFPFEGQLGEFIAFPSVLENGDKWSINAFLLSKWKGYSAFDASRSTIPVNMSAPESLLTPVVMMGGVADDVLSATGQESILYGGVGSDTLSGGSGRDRFIVTSDDIVKGFSEYATVLISDVLDLSQLLPAGTAALEKCLYFAPTGSDTTVSVNKGCTGEDLVFGSDFTDAQFTIEGQGLWNTDIPVLWRTGALFAGSHRPGNLKAGLNIGDEGLQVKEINENSGNEGIHQALYLSYTGGQPYEGKNLDIPLTIGGTATPYDDFTLSLKRYIDPMDTQFVSELTDGQYSYYELENLDESDLVAMGILIEENRFDPGFFNIFQRYDVLKDYEVGSPVFIPAQLTEDNETHKRLVFDLVVNKDSMKENDETIILKLNSVPEYFDLVPDSGELMITITDGLDKVFTKNTKATVSEGRQSQFTLYRTGSIDQPLIIDVSLSGLAENGKDYSTIPSQLTFAKGEKSLVIPFQTLTDDISEPMEMVELRVLSSGRYDIDATKNIAQLTIQDEALNFVDTDKDGLPDSWELAVGLNPNVSNQLDEGYRDSDEDGLSDQEEYRLGTNPMKADSDGDGIMDGQDADPNDADVKAMDQLKGYQMVKAGRDNEINVPLGMDRIIEIPLDYLTSDGSDQVSGLGLILKYNADQLEYLGVDQVLPNAHASTGGPMLSEVYRGGYKLFTHQVPVTWDASGGDWPSLPLPAKLLSARFKVAASATVGQQFMIGVDAQSAAEGYAFKPTQLVVNVMAPGAMDILANEQDLAEEGLMLARHLAGLSPEMTEFSEENVELKLTAEEIGRIQQHIERVGLQYDVDGDGVVNPLSDAVLIYHYLQDDGLTDERVQAVLGAETSVKAVDVVTRIREIQEGVQ